MPVVLKDLLTELKSRLMDLYAGRMKALCLYGSYARGEQQGESDVDVLIMWTGLTGTRWRLNSRANSFPSFH